MNSPDPIAELRDLVARGMLSRDTISVATGTSSDELGPILSGEKAVADPHVGMSLSLLAAQLMVGTKIDDEERLQGILVTLTQQYSATLANISALTGLQYDDLSTLEREPEELSASTKFSMAIRLYHLLTVLSPLTQNTRGEGGSHAIAK